MQRLVRLENLALLGATLALYAWGGWGWGTFLALFLVPDVALFAWLASPRLGARSSARAGRGSKAPTAVDDALRRRRQRLRWRAELEPAASPARPTFARPRMRESRRVRGMPALLRALVAATARPHPR